MRPKLRYCNEPDCVSLAQPGWSKCEPHGKAAAEANRLQRERWARDAAVIQADRRLDLASALGIDADVLDDLVAYIKEQ